MENSNTENSVAKVISQTSFLQLLPEEHDHFLVYEQRTDGTYTDMFDSLIEKANRDNNRKKLCVVRAKDNIEFENRVMLFVRKHQELFLHSRWHLILVKHNDWFVVTEVLLRVSADKNIWMERTNLNYDYIWSAEYRHRIIVPKQ